MRVSVNHPLGVLSPPYHDAYSQMTYFAEKCARLSQAHDVNAKPSAQQILGLKDELDKVRSSIAMVEPPELRQVTPQLCSCSISLSPSPHAHAHVTSIIFLILILTFAFTRILILTALYRCQALSPPSFTLLPSPLSSPSPPSPSRLFI